MDGASAQAPSTLQLHHHHHNPDSHEHSAQHQQPQPTLPHQQSQPQLNAAAVAHHPTYPHQGNQFLEPDNNAAAAAGRFTEEWDASQRGSSILVDHHHGATADMQRSASVHSYAAGDDQNLPIRNNNTLRKKSSMRRSASSAGRSSSRRSNRAGSVRSLAMNSATDPDEAHSAFYCPVPTSGTPTTVLAERFQTWRKVLKDLIAYFREIQTHYEHRAKALGKLNNAANNLNTPPQLLKSAGIDDAVQMVRGYNKAAIAEANKAKDIEEDVILALTGLRSDLQQKIKEIKQLSGDFKNSVEKEMSNTRRAVGSLSDILDKNEEDSSSTTGKQDPFLLRLAVDRQVERQIDEENYLHQAYLNLEGSGRELESIVVGEIQKAYNAYAGILKREAENAFGLVGELRDGPIAMPKDQEWIHFVTHEDQVVDPTVPLRSADQIHYPGQEHLAAQEIRAGLLERKSKYLKSYTAGWYVLSSTHLHEFKSADKAQGPIMSLYLPEQKLGSHSEDGSSSNKFILKGRQTGTMHRGHTWVFRAESYDTMLAWFEDIKALTEKSGEERSQFVRTHSRSLSRSSRRSARSASSDGLDDEDEEPFSGGEVDTNPAARPDAVPRRPEPGGRFPSDLQINAQRGLQAPQSPSSLSSGHQEPSSDAHATAAAGAIPGAPPQDGETYQDSHGYGGSGYTPMGEMSSQAAIVHQQAQYDGVNPYTSEPVAQTDGSYTGGAYMAVNSVQNTQDDSEGQAPREASDVQTGDSSAAVNGENYTNTGEQGESANTTAAGEAGVPRSEVDAVDKPLQVVPELDVAAHESPAHTPLGEAPPRSNRPEDHRTDSVVTISNLDIPGRFPKGGANQNSAANPVDATK